MKKYLEVIICLCSILSFNSAINAQCNGQIKTITLDMNTQKKDTTKSKNAKTRTLTIEDDISQGDCFVLEITGLNLYNYKVTVNHQDSLIIKSISSPSFGSLGLDVLTTLVNQISTSGISGTVSLEEVPFALQANLLDLEDLKKIDSIMSQVPPIPDVGIDSLKQRIKEEKNTLSSFNNSLQAWNEELDNWQFKINKKKLEARKNVPSNTPFDYDNALMQIQTSRNTIKNIHERVKASQAAYMEFYERNKTTIDQLVELKKQDELIKKAYSQILTIITTSKKATKAESMLEVLTSVVYIDNLINESYVSLPFQFNNDQNKLEIALTPWDSESRLPSHKAEYIFPEIKSYQGLGASFYASDLHDRGYSTEKVLSSPEDTVGTFNIIDEELNKSELGTAALLRFGKKVDKAQSFGYHFSFGAGVSLTQKIRPRLLLGGGITLGKSHMLAIDVGGIAGYVERISNIYTENRTNLPSVPEEITISKIQTGLFFSIGYLHRL